MTEKNSSETMSLEINPDVNHNESKIHVENCCSNTPIYEISYNHIPRKWLVCNQCLELDFFKTDIKEKVRVQA